MPTSKEYIESCISQLGRLKEAVEKFPALESILDESFKIDLESIDAQISELMDASSEEVGMKFN